MPSGRASARASSSPAARPVRPPVPAVAGADEALLRSLGAKVRRLRADRGMTLAELAATSGISARFLADLEAGRANISIVNLAHVAAALGASAIELLEAPGTPNVALLGLRGAGKSSVGAALAARLGIPLVELDELVEETAGLPLDEVFRVHGESYYRRVEGEALGSFLARGEPAVLATGGGIVTSPDNFSRLRRGCFTVWLRARPEDHMRRVERQGDLRPMARRPNAMEELRQILETRAALYSQADLVVDTHGAAPEEVARRIELRLARTAAARSVSQRREEPRA